MRLLVLQHIACEHPGVFSEVMRTRGEAVAVELDAGEPLPDWREFDGVLAMGGPMGAGDEATIPGSSPRSGWCARRSRRGGRSSASASGSSSSPRRSAPASTRPSEPRSACSRSS